MKTVVGFTTYPSKFPIHGGQRRVHAFADYYRSIGLHFESVCIFESQIYPNHEVGSYDLPLRSFESEYSNIPLIGDLLSGLYAAGQPRIVDHFVKVLLEKRPRAITLEQPFMWPLVKKLREQADIRKIPLIYSSQNWEPSLKQQMLLSCGVDRKIAQLVEDKIEEIEREAVAASDLIFAVSEDDAKIYSGMSPKTEVLVIRNGVDRPPKSFLAIPEEFEKRRYFFFVGSAYPPNIDGICSLVFDDGLFFVPPQKSFAICGGVSHGIFLDARYQQFQAANSARVSFFERISDEHLNALKASAHAFLLPIEFGGGSNLKTAEALASGKWVIATSVSMRGFEKFANEPGVIIADRPTSFRKAVMEVYRKPSLQLSADARAKRDLVYWDNCFNALPRECRGFELLLSDKS